jgi:hypothetical protein
MRIKIDFKKLLCGYYCDFSPEIDFEMINWFFKTGLEGNGYEDRCGWYKCGINQLLYGYSGNNENCTAVPFPIGGDLEGFIRSIFINAIVAPHSWDCWPGAVAKVAEWRKKTRIDINRYRFFDFPDPSQNNPRQILWNISTYEGRELKKLFAHPDFPNRTHPKIIAVIFSTCGQGYFVKIMFSFWEFNYEPGWNLLIAKQNDGEYLGDFLARAERKLKTITVDMGKDKRAQFEKKNKYLNFIERGCFNCIWYNRHRCGCMEFGGIKNCSITNPRNHLCDEWKYNYKLIGKFPNESVWRRKNV